MTTINTKDRILRAAEQLFAEGGYKALAMRSVTKAAEVNLAAVNYHFGSKLALAQAILHDFITPLSARQVELLNELEARPGLPSVEELVTALISPLVDAFEREGEQGRFQVQMFGRAMTEPSRELWEVIMQEVGEVRTRFIAAFGRALSHLSEDELWWRYKTISAILVIDQSGIMPIPQPPEISSPPLTTTYNRDRLVNFLSAALQAPASHTK